MTSEVIIDVHPKEISIALLEDKSLVEYQNETRSASFSVGNIYMAKVKKLMPGLNACFVDVGFERDAFLHYLDLGSQFSSYEKYLKQVQSDRKKLYPISKATRLPELKKDGSVQTTLKVGQEVISYVIKKGTGMVMAPGMVFTIEPMINAGLPDIYIDEGNNWTIYTDDDSYSAQWEIMVHVTEDGYEVMSY